MIWSALKGGETIFVKNYLVCKNYDMVCVKGGRDNLSKKMIKPVKKDINCVKGGER